jgi:streptogramin lyase
MTGTLQQAKMFALATLACVSMAGSLCGCGAGFVGETKTASPPVASAVTGIHGSAFGGTQPIVGAAIQLYEANTASGYGSGSKPLLPTINPVTTDANGAFNITGTYTCDSGALVYITATGGNPGLSKSNTSIALMAALGPCSSVSTSAPVHINELTTVASVYALAQFMNPGSYVVATAPYSNIGTSSTNIAGLTQAFADVNQLVNINTGTAPGPALPAGASFSVDRLNTLANVVAACVNSTGLAPGTPQGGKTVCDALFNAATTAKANGIKPTDTLTAVYNIVLAPSTNVQALFNLVTGLNAFQPTLAAAPNDWTLAINYTAGGMATPSGLAVDASGNVWIANRTGNSVSELTHAGVPVGGSPFTGSLNAPSAIAMDTNGVPWVANSGNNSLVYLKSSGGVPVVATGGGLNAPMALALDAQGNVWAADGGTNLLSQFSSTGAALSSTGFGPAGTVKPFGTAISPH